MNISLCQFPTGIQRRDRSISRALYGRKGVEELLDDHRERHNRLEQIGNLYCPERFRILAERVEELARK